MSHPLVLILSCWHGQPQESELIQAKLWLSRFGKQSRPFAANKSL